MKPGPITDREFFNLLCRQEGLRKLRVLFDHLLEHPVWWLCFKSNGGSRAFRRSLEGSYGIWRDPRIRRFRPAGVVYRTLKKRAREKRPFAFQAPHGTSHFCIPLVWRDRVTGYLGISGMGKGVRQEVLNLLAGHVGLVVHAASQEEDLKRLSATIRPRAIALSTVHTVHRIINSTLNLDELVSRLAHLTAQVLRARRCAIYLLEKTGGKLILKALVGAARRRRLRRASFVSDLENRVAKSARSLLRKKFICVPLIDEDVIGVVTVSSKKEERGFTHFDQEILTTLAEEAVIAIKNAQLYEEQKRVTLGTIQSLAVILGTRVENIVSPQVFLQIALFMAEELKLGEEETQALHYAALLKDTAKIGIPDEILKKPTKLTGEEYQLLREHPIKGAKIVQSFESLKPVVPIILYSREKYDGTGYPEGLKGDKIPIGARILSVINTFEAIIMGRPYRGRSSVEEAIEEIARNSGTQFDPKVVETFIRALKRINVKKLFNHAR